MNNDDVRKEIEMAELKAKVSIQTAILQMLFVLAAMPLRAYVFKTLWWWLLVPLGLPPVGLWHALGLGWFVTLVTYRATDEKGYTWEQYWQFCVWAPLIALGAGWLAKTMAF